MNETKNITNNECAYNFIWSYSLIHKNDNQAEFKAIYPVYNQVQLPTENN